LPVNDENIIKIKNKTRDNDTTCLDEKFNYLRVQNLTQGYFESMIGINDDTKNFLSLDENKNPVWIENSNDVWKFNDVECSDSYCSAKIQHEKTGRYLKDNLLNQKKLTCETDPLYIFKSGLTTDSPDIITFLVETDD
jgi:hypothetical protein